MSIRSLSVASFPWLFAKTDRSFTRQRADQHATSNQGKGRERQQPQQKQARGTASHAPQPEPRATPAAEGVKVSGRNQESSAHSAGQAKKARPRQRKKKKEKSEQQAEDKTSRTPQPGPRRPELPPPHVKRTAEAVKAEGNAAFKASRWGEAVGRYTEAIRLDPGDAIYYSNRAAAYMSLKKYQLALNDCQEANKLQGDSVAKTLVRTARCHVHLGETTRAGMILREIINGAPSSSSTFSRSTSRFTRRTL